MSSIENIMKKDDQIMQNITNCSIDDKSLAMAYVPMQGWIDTYDPETGFNRGTIFPGLDKPFIGEEAVPNGRKK